MKKTFCQFLKICKFFFLLLIFIINNSYAYSNTDIYEDIFKPSCETIFSESNQDSLNLFKDISIIYNASKLKKKIGVKYQELKEFDSTNLYLSGQLKKKSNYSKVKLKFKDKKCVLASRVKMTGDLSDHIEFNSNYMKSYSSFMLLLDDESILGNTEYKFFLPQTRNFENEVFVANLFSELGFLSPRTAIFDIYINGKKKKFIIQENINKNFLEFNNYKESLLIEGSEILGLDSKIGLSKVKNKSWAIRNRDNLKIALNAISTLNQVYYSHTNIIDDDNTDPVVQTSLINQRKSNILREFDALSYALKTTSGLSRNDRRFYFEPINGNYIPIYYDGMSTILDDTANIVVKLPKSFEKSLDSIRTKLYKIEFAKFQKKLANNGLELSIYDLKKLINNIIFNIEILKNTTSKLNVITYNLDKAHLSNLKNLVNKIIFTNLNKNLITYCDYKLIKCKQEKLKSSDLNEIFPENNFFNPTKKPNIYFGNFNDYEEFFIKYKEIISFTKNSKIIKIDNTIIYHTDNVKINIDRNTRTIKIINENNFNNRTLFTEGNLTNWKIISESNNKNSNHNEKLTHYSLTGCLNFYNIEVIDINLDIKDSHCEDAVNFVNTKGNITKVKIFNSKFDGMDIDFSELEIDNATVYYSHNDCIDLSSGKYIINSVALNTCEDKGISAGEKTSLYIENIKVENSKIGLAVKDSSNVIVKNYDSSNLEKCAMIYRKKKEFVGGMLSITNKDCDNSQFYVQENSVLKLYETSN